MYDKRLAFKILLYLTIALIITLLSESHPPDEIDENTDVPYQSVVDDITMVTDIHRHNNYVVKRETEDESQRKSSNENLIHDSTGDSESEENQVNNESTVENEENEGGGKEANFEDDGDKNSDIENQDQTESEEEQMKNEDFSKNNVEGRVNREKRVNKAGSSHKTRPSLNRLTNYKNKGNSENTNSN
uniref:Uncharacterized protein n=1 Tax=Strongyloides venezuelensis TaxID=75913 RepID=A0A0K0EXI0_STRVS